MSKVWGQNSLETFTQIFCVRRCDGPSDAKVLAAQVEQVHGRDGVETRLQRGVLDEAIALNIFNKLRIRNFEKGQKFEDFLSLQKCVNILAINVYQ